MVVTNSNPRMRVASNLPPHLEQQLQQHSMMRNTAPRQQQQGQAGGVRMVRSVSGAQGTWRPANQQQQQQIILQRSAANQSEPRLQQPQQQQQVHLSFYLSSSLAQPTSNVHIDTNHESV